MPSRDENTGIAFALVIGAGAATALGAAVVFVPWLVRLASRRTLAGALGLSAGVMTYVSFVEIFQKSNDSFLDAGKAEDVAYALATVCFFGGAAFMILLNHVVTQLLGGHHHHHHDTFATEPSHATQRSSKDLEDVKDTHGDSSNVNPACPCCSENPAEDLRRVQGMAQEIEEYEQNEHREWEGQQSDLERTSNNPEPADEEEPNQTAAEAAHSQKLMRMSINTALAIALHNFPEGLATFVAALQDPRVGVVLAVAIAIHNVPEGLCVAMPIYYATGNKWKAFMWAVLSGVSEPIAALLGWAVLASSFSDAMYASLFGVVSGMMVIISVRELLPTAHRYDPEDSVVTYSFIGGMMIMAASLVLFVL